MPDLKRRIKEYLIRLDIKRALQGKTRFLHWGGEGRTDENLDKQLEAVRLKLAEAFGEEKRGIREIGEIRGDLKNQEQGKIKKEAKKITKLVSGDPKLETLSEVAKKSKYKREYLGYLVRQKKLRAQKVGGAWKTTLEWVKDFEREAEKKKTEIKKELSKKMGEGAGVLEAILEIWKGKFAGTRRLAEIVKQRKNILFWKAGKSWRQTKAEIDKIFSLRQISRPLTALAVLVMFIALANITRADLANWRDEAAKRIALGYNAAVEKAAAVAKPLEKIKISRTAIDEITNKIVGRKKVRQFEEKTGLSLAGSEEEKVSVVEEEGVVAGEEMGRAPNHPAGAGATGQGIVLAETTEAGKMNIGDVEVSAYLLGQDGRPVTNGDYEVRFSLYSVDRAQSDPYPSDVDRGSRVWEETQTVSIQDGLLTGYLGKSTPIPESLDFGSKIYYLGVRVGEDAELVPRKRIGAVPLARTAMNALTAQTLSGYTVGNAAGNIPVSNGTLNTNLNAELLDGMQAGDFVQTGDTAFGYQSWKLAASSSDTGQKIKNNKAAIFAGASGITTTRTLNTLTISPAYGSTANTVAQGNTAIAVSTTGNLQGGGSGTAGGGLSLTLDTVASPAFTDITASGDLNLTAPANLIFGGATSLGETTAATDSGAYLVGVSSGGFINSASTNVQDVLSDFDVAIAGGGPGSMWTLSAGGVIYPTDATNDLAIGGTTLAASVFGIDESAGNFYFGYDNSANPTLLFEATDADAGSFGFNANDAFYITGANFGIETTNPASFKLEVAGDIGPEADNTRNLGSPTRYFNTAYVNNIISGGSGTVGYWSRTGTTLSPVTNGDTVAVYAGAGNTSGTLLGVSYTVAATLDGDLIGMKVDLNDGFVTPTNQSVTGLRVVLPTTTNTNAAGTITYNGMSLGYGVGTGINQNGAGETIYNGANLQMPALTQTAGTLTANGVLVTTSSSITTGGTANAVKIAATGVNAGSLNGVYISAITASGGAETAVNIGSGWDSVLSVNGSQVVNGSGVVQVAAGGTGLTTYAVGDLIYATGAATLANLVAGVANNGKVLVVSAGVPTWGVMSGSACTDCVLNDPTSVTTQTIQPSTDISSLVVKKTSFGGATQHIFQVVGTDGTPYFYVDKDGNVSTGGTASQTLTLTPLSDTTALTLVGTNVPTASLQYINSKNTQGTILNIAYGDAGGTTLAGSLTGQSINLATNVTADDQSVTGLSITLPAATNTTSTSYYKGLVVSGPVGSGINQSGAGTTVFSGVDVTIPALTQTAGSLTANGVNVTTPLTITTGGTANGLNIAASGVGAGTLRGINVSDITGAAGAETGLYVGTGWDYAAIFMGGNVGIGTSSPDAALTFPASSTGIKLYNNAGGTEYGRLYWNSNRLKLTVNDYRAFELNVAAESIYLQPGYSNTIYLHSSTSGSNTAFTMVNLAGQQYALSGTEKGFRISTTFTSPSASSPSSTTVYPFVIEPTIDYANAVRTGSYEALRIAPIETSLPTGQNYLIRALAGASGTTDEFWVTNTGGGYFAGNVGIGTTSPEGKLSVVGSTSSRTAVQIREDSTGDPVLWWSLGGTTPWALGVDNSAGDNLIFANSYDLTNPKVTFEYSTGNVGIGTTSPGAKLEVYGSAATQIVINVAAGNYGEIFFKDGGLTKWRIGKDGSNNLRIYSDTAGANAYFQNIGNVGIGTTAPGAKLEIYGSSNKLRLALDATSYSDLYEETATGNFVISNQSNAATVLKSSAGDASLYLYEDTDGGTNKVRFRTDSAGGLGIDPDANIAIAYNTSVAAQLQFYGGDTTADILFNPTGNSYFNTGGNVGIGTTSPEQLLHLAYGHMKFTTFPEPTSAPTAALAGMGGNLSNTTSYPYKWAVVFLTATGQTSFSPASNEITVVDHTTNGQVNLTNIPTGPPGTTGRRIYRTKIANNWWYYKLIDIGDNTTTTYTDNTADSSLGPEAMMMNYDSDTTAGRIYIDSNTGMFLGKTVTSLGVGALNTSVTGSGNSAFGYYALYSANVSSSSNTAVGSNALQNVSSGGGNTGLGFQAGRNITTGLYNIAIGSSPMSTGTITGSDNIAIGTNTLANPGAGSYNIILGREAGNVLTGSNNVMIGYYSGYSVTSGTGNVFIGNQAGKSATGSNQLYIANSDATSLFYGNFSTGAVGIGGTAAHTNPHLTILTGGYVGIGTTSPGDKLHVAGSIRIDGLGAGEFWQWIGGTNSVSYKDWSGHNLMVLNGSTNNIWLGGTAAHTSPTMAIQGSGNVGIGTTNPGARLDIIQSSNTNSGGIFLEDTAGIGITRFWRSGNGSSSYFMITDRGVDTLALNAGYVGIGTTSPTDLLTVHAAANHNFIVENGSLGVRISGSQDDGIASASLELSSLPGSTHMIIQQTTGYVGIGTTSPGSKLHIYDSGHLTPTFESGAGNVYLQLTTGSGASSEISFRDSATAGFIKYNHADDSMRFRVGGSELLSMIGGNVGIGVTSPSDRLDINGGVKIGAGYVNIGLTAPANGLLVQGNVGIGTTSPSYRLHVVSSDTVQAQFTKSGETGIQIRGGTYGMLTTSSGADLAFGYNGLNEVMRITTGGLVGIGTSSPDHKLDVNGNVGIAASGYLNFGATDGESGYGIRDSGGTLQYKNSGGAWAAIGSGSLWTDGGATTYLDALGDNVGIGTTSTSAKLHVVSTKPIYDSDQCSGGTATASSQYLGYGPDNAFDDNDTTFWEANAVTTGWIKYQFSSAKTIKRYTIEAHASYATRAPNTWTLEGSNNDSDWDVLDSQSGQSGWDGNKRTYSIDNSTSYLYYRIDVSANDGGTDLLIAEIEMMTATTGDSDFVVQNGRLGIDMTNPLRPIDTSTGAYLSEGGAWTDSSDRARKENIREISGSDILDKLMTLSVSTWNYKDQSESVRHIGPMAQDFYSVFGFGEDNLHIAALDSSGLALASVKELNWRLMGERARLDELTVRSSQTETAVIAQGTMINNLNLKIDENISGVSDLQTAVNEKLSLVGASLNEQGSMINDQQDRITNLSAEVADYELRITEAENRLLEIENNLATFETATNDTLSAMLETESMLTQRILDHEERIEEIEEKIATLTISGGEIPDNVVIKDSDGNVRLAGLFEAKEVVAGAYSVKSDDPARRTMGGEVIFSGEDAKIVETKAISDSAKVFVTFEGDPGARWWTEKIINPVTGEFTGFAVRLSAGAAGDVKFSWWVVEEK